MMNLAEFQATGDIIDKSDISMKQNAEDTQADRQIQEEEYNPFANRPSAPLISDFAAFVHLFKCAIGTGILFLPHAFRRTGYIISIICGIVIGALATHTAVIIVQCSQALCRRNRVPMLDFAETAQFSFQTGPERIRKYARLFGVVTNVIICFVHFQGAVIYILYVATSFQQPGPDSQDSHFFIGVVYFGLGVLRSDQHLVADDSHKNRHEELAVSSIVRNLTPISTAGHRRAPNGTFTRSVVRLGHLDDHAADTHINRNVN